LSSAHEKWGQKQNIYKCCIYNLVQCNYLKSD